MKTNRFKELVNYINSIEEGKTLTRKSIKEALKIDEKRDAMTTIDTYRNMFTKAGYISWEDVGVYKKVKQVGEDITWEKLFEEAFGKKRKKY